MKKKLLTLFFILIFSPAVFASNNNNFFKLSIFDNDTHEIKALLHSQIKYANRAKFDKFISTFDKDYLNADGFDLETYSDIVKDVWNTYDNIVYGIKIKDIEINGNNAKVDVQESSYADISFCPKMLGTLKSESSSIYYLKKTNGRWKVISDKVLKEDTSMLYGNARNLQIKLSAPEEIGAGKEYTASLEFTPPKDTIAIASIANDTVEYPQKQPKEVYRKFPEDNILERLFTSNQNNLNEYIVASIGLTKADIEDLSIKLSLTGFGYKIVRVNVLPENSEDKNVENE